MQHFANLTSKTFFLSNAFVPWNLGSGGISLVVGYHSDSLRGTTVTNLCTVSGCWHKPGKYVVIQHHVE